MDQPERVGECRQQIEISEPKAEITEYRQIIVSCACGGEHRGVFPSAVGPQVSSGPRLKAYAVGLVDGHFVGLARTAKSIADQYGVKPSDGTIQTCIGQAAIALNGVDEANRQAILAADVAHFDESGGWVNGHTHWLHVAGTAEHAIYTIHPRRGQEAMTAAGLLPRFTGVAVHDHWAPYFGFGQATHALCNAHLLRELRYFEEVTEGHRRPIKLREVLVDAKKAVAEARVADQSAVDPDRRAELLARYDR